MIWQVELVAVLRLFESYSQILFFFGIFLKDTVSTNFVFVAQTNGTVQELLFLIKNDQTITFLQIDWVIFPYTKFAKCYR